MAATKRIGKEVGDWNKEGIDGIRIITNENGVPPDLYKWEVDIDGPPGTPYAGGTFRVAVDFPDNYPFKAPAFHFRTRIWHPNITNDDEGNICIDVLKPDQWKPSVSIKSLLKAIQNLLAQPNPDDPLEPRIADEYRQSPNEFAKNAKAYVDRHAKGGKK